MVGVLKVPVLPNTHGHGKDGLGVVALAIPRESPLTIKVLLLWM